MIYVMTFWLLLLTQNWLFSMSSKWFFSPGSNMKKQEGEVTVFSDGLWTDLLDYATAYADGRMTFTRSEEHV